MPKSRRLNRTDWLESALRALVADGIAGVRVERLARDLGVTKGSFYWHFEDHPALLRGLLDHWVEVHTTAIMDMISHLPETGLYERLAALETMLNEVGGREVEWAVQAWSHVDERVREVLADIETRRREFVKGLFRDGGFAEEEAEVRARLYVAYRTAWLLTTICDGGQDEDHLTEIRLRLLTERQGD